MPKKKQRRHGSAHGPRRTGRGPARARVTEPDLLRQVRGLLREDGPMDLLAYVSSMMAALDPGRRDPLAAGRAAPAGPTLQELARTFIEVPAVETTALLTVLAELVDDAVLAQRIRRELARREDRLPEWLRLAPLTATRAVELSHVLGDGDSVMVEARTAAGHSLTVMAYIDHNLGTVLKDGFVVPGPLPQLMATVRASGGDDPDVTLRELDLAGARARITEAIAVGALMSPPFESETWPAARPLVEWITRLLPAGGSGYQRPEWSDRARRQLTLAFFRSPFAAGIGEDDRQLFDSILWFACDYGPGDPLHWSPTAIEILLLDWLPRKIMAEPEFLLRAPDLLRRFVRYAHAERGIRAALTADTLAMVDTLEGEYAAIIRAPRLQGPAALLAAMGDWPTPTYEELLLDALHEEVGDDAALSGLTADPLPAEELDLRAVAPDVHPAVREVGAVVDRWCDEVLDVEYRTACRRFLADVAAADPATFRGRGRSDTAAAAVAWTVAKANNRLGQHAGAVTAKRLNAFFGVTASPSTRAARMLAALGIDVPTGAFVLRLGTPRYLVSARRAGIVERRDRARAAQS